MADTDNAAFEEKDVRVTSSVVSIEGKTYALAAIESARLRMHRPRKYLIAGGFYLGALLLFLVDGVTGDSGNPTVEQALTYGQWACLILSAALFVWSRREIRYKVELDGASGRTEVFSSPDKWLVLRTVRAINNAITKRQQGKPSSG